MTTAPQWASVDDGTASLLALIADADEWQTFYNALHDAADEHGVISPNRLRPLVRGRVAPGRIGAMTNRAKAEGLIVWTGAWETSDDTEGRNGGKPMRCYRLVKT